ncbi:MULTISPECIES: TetR/AcrR family transcriptional regulator [unclassified Duganella]|uniref:TetR/AcrR family transcriptional regulator n=1 Tax=unclassified Duganella TaxID=2636909 RepID=UPI0006F86723|nr:MULTISPECIES: TetR/AcrR family transcriptional regulator [unclassified Duganella]KQN77475.1 TetR family transcriptional regulator [Duganella sp. Leaf61]
MTTSPAKRRVDPEKAAGRRNQVLEAAAVCFARSGFHGASMSEISKQAGMSAGHIYNYFDGKNAIILAFVEAHSEYVSDMLSNLNSLEDPLQAMIDDAERHVTEALDPQPWHVSIEMYAEASRNPVIAERLRAHEDSARGQLRELVRRGRERRNLSVEDVLLDSRIDTMIAYFHGLTVRALHRPDMNRAGLTEAFQVAMRALLMT